MTSLRFFFPLFSLVLLFSCNNQIEKRSDPLSSWNEGKTKQAIEDFVNEVTDPQSPYYVAPGERIATFDNDGTLWSEKPYYFQLQFAMDRVKEIASDHPEWSENPLFQAVIDNDIKQVLSFGEHGLLEIVMATHAGMTTDEFRKIVRDWINTARHPKTNRLYKDMVFQPMLELLDYFQDHGFKTYIVSGGGVDFMRPWVEEVYGIPPEQVIGSSIKAKFEMQNGQPVLVKIPELNFIDDKEGKPVGIHQFIGKKPLAAFGNSDGDLQMLQWTDSGEERRLMVYIHHTDSEREWAYDRESAVGRLDQGLDMAENQGWIVVDMKKDWQQIFSWERLD